MQSAPTAAAPGGGGQSHTGAIVGGVVGGLAGLILILGLAGFVVMQHRYGPCLLLQPDMVLQLEALTVLVWVCGSPYCVYLFEMLRGFSPSASGPGWLCHHAAQGWAALKCSQSFLSVTRWGWCAAYLADPFAPMWREHFPPASRPGRLRRNAAHMWAACM